MRPVLFSIGNIEFHSWSFMFFVAVITVFLLALKETPWQQVEEKFKGKFYDYALEAFLMSFFLAIIGSRLMFVVTHWELVAGKPWWEILAFWRGGMVYYGGLFAVIAGGAFYCYYRGIRFWETADHIIAYAPLGYAIARVGCFLNGCCYGKVTGMPWGVVFPVVDALPRHPTQLYSSVSALVIFFILRRLKIVRPPFDGYIVAWFLLLYGAYRFIVEFFRVSDPVLLSLTLAQVTALVFMAAGAVTLLVKKRNYYVPL